MRSLLLLGVGVLTARFAWAQSCLPYEPDAVQLTGMVEYRTFPGPPNHNKVRGGSRAETAVLLTVSTPFCVGSKNTSEVNPPVADVRLVQLIFANSEQLKSVNSLGARQGTFKGLLFHAFDGHHHTDVLLRVKSLQVAR